MLIKAKYLPISKIHQLRLKYNRYINQLLITDEELYPEYLKRKVIYYRKIYPLVNLKSGMVCQICGLDGFERKILEDSYKKINFKLELVIIEINAYYPMIRE